jgi:hypothetical protein
MYLTETDLGHRAYEFRFVVSWSRQRHLMLRFGRYRDYGLSC